MVPLAIGIFVCINYTICMEILIYIIHIIQWAKRILWFQYRNLIQQTWNKYKIIFNICWAYISIPSWSWSGIWSTFWGENKKIYIKKRELYLFQGKTASHSLSLNEIIFAQKWPPVVQWRWISYQKKGQTFLTKFNVVLF